MLLSSLDIGYLSELTNYFKGNRTFWFTILNNFSSIGEKKNSSMV